MKPGTIDLAGREELLDEILTEYLRAMDAGQTPDRCAVLARHPDLSAELMEFFAEQDRLDRWAEPLRRVAQAARIDEVLTPPHDGTVAGPGGADPGAAAGWSGNGSWRRLARAPRHWCRRRCRPARSPAATASTRGR